MSNETSLETITKVNMKLIMFCQTESLYIFSIFYYSQFYGTVSLLKKSLSQGSRLCFFP